MTQEFEKLKKKFVLNNSYFKNRQHNSPGNPFEVLEYYKEHKELPYNNGSITENWFYECFCEYQKRVGIRNSQFFTPSKTAERMVEILSEYSEFDESERILDACCGFGQITKSLKNQGYKQIEGFDNDRQMVNAYFDLTGFDARVFDFNEAQFADKYNIIISNPPYEGKDLTAFLEFVDKHLHQTGKAILLIPNGFLDKQRPLNLVQILNKFHIEKREKMSEKFERTGVDAEIVVLSKY